MPSPADYEDTPLVAAAGLAPFGTFTEDAALAAGQGIRRETNWHISPSVTETLTLYSEGGTVLLLPSLKVTAVTAIRDVTDADVPETLTGWSFRANGVLKRNCGWPTGHAIEVDVTHGYDACPAELLPVLARRARDTSASTAGSVRLGSLQIGTTSVGTTITATDEAIIRRYSL